VQGGLAGDPGNLMLTLVPARGGSKRIPRKNIRPLAGIPLLLWTLIPFRSYNPVVSSDDPEILDLAKQHGFGVIERPAELASDEASSAAVAMHALEQRGEDVVLLLQPTSPFRSARTVESAISLFKVVEKPVATFRDAPHVFQHRKPVSDAEAPTGNCYIIHRRDLVDTFLPETYACVPDTVLGAIDIDTEEDWQLAQVVAQANVGKLKDMMLARAGWTG
jgi:CMP-N,N'-diacetyllegionaminic acid synthase